ncbi:MAG TPA: response regulator [Planctomycetaceae bacterium]|nr:response regulator [Planctomycetaceae bacterium]
MPLPIVLVVESSGLDAAVLRETIEPDGFRVVVARSAREAIGRAHRLPVEMAVINVQLSDFDGLSLAPLLRAIHENIAIIYTSNWHEATIEAQARRLGAVFYTPKPFDPRVIRRTLLSAYTASRPAWNV